jgi:glycosyltransferase involved in cell wall biosynthesis
MKVLYNVLKATSTIQQMELIKKLLEEKGCKHEYKSTFSVFDVGSPKYDAFLWFTHATCIYLTDVVAPYLTCKKPKAVYVTIEGVPTKANFLNSNIPKLKMIAVSDFVKECLIAAGLEVIDVVHHGVDLDLCEFAETEAEMVAKKWDEEFGDRVRFLYVGRDDPRKGLDNLAKAMAILDEKYKDKYVVFFHGGGDNPQIVERPNSRRLGQFGTLPYRMVLAFMGACHYLVFPSKAEGFGLPLLEANAMGKPAIHAWFPPLSEFSDKDFNFVFEYNDEFLMNRGGVQNWIIHEYRPALLAEMMAFAIDVKNTKPEEYQEYCAKAKEHAKKWDYHNTYPKLLSHLGVK